MFEALSCRSKAWLVTVDENSTVRVRVILGDLWAGSESVCCASDFFGCARRTQRSYCECGCQRELGHCTNCRQY